MNKIKISWYGSGLEIRRLFLPENIKNEWEEMALRQNRSLIDILLDPFFYYKLKNIQYNSIEDLSYDKFSGLLNESKNQIEIWFNRKKIFKTNTIELYNEAVLFPLFNLNHISESFTDKKGIYIVQKEIGNLGVYELEVDKDNLLIDDFTFETQLYQNSKIISGITHQNQYFPFIKKDTVITQQYGFEVKLK